MSSGMLGWLIFCAVVIILILEGFGVSGSGGLK